MARTSSFETSRPLTRLSDAIALQRQVALETEDALAQFKGVLESGEIRG